MNLAAAKTIFFHGIGGTGMRGLAWLLYEQGRKIRGTDTNLPIDLPRTWSSAPEKNAASLLDECDVYIHSDAVPPEHVLYIKAETRGLRMYSYQDALGAFASDFQTVAVAGTHGKSSTTAFLAHILITAGKDPSVLVGASVPTWPGKHARAGGSNLFIVEADEYRDHFLTLKPSGAVITSMEYDHPDYFDSMEDIVSSFQNFINLLPEDGTLVVPRTVENSELTLPPHAHVVSTADAPQAPLPGVHMQQNATLAIAMAQQLGVAKQEALMALQTFPGLHRRFEIIGTIDGTVFISDYAHHPTEIAVTLAAARNQYPRRRIGVLFEPHTVERLRFFGGEFADELAKADGVLLYPPFIPTGRGSTANQALKALQTKLQASGRPLRTLHAREELPEALTYAIGEYQVILACSAGILDADMRKIVNRG